MDFPTQVIITLYVRLTFHQIREARSLTPVGDKVLIKEQKGILVIGHSI